MSAPLSTTSQTNTSAGHSRAKAASTSAACVAEPVTTMSEASQNVRAIFPVSSADSAAMKMRKGS